MPNNQRRHREQMGVLDQIHDTLTEIRDRLPEREVACTRPEPGDVAEEPDEPMRTLPEAISGRIVIPHPSFSLEITSDGISPDLYAILTGSAMPAADITEEPPVGSQVTDKDGHVWERRGDDGWAIWRPVRSRWATYLDGGWPVVRDYAPLRPTTDADRVRVGLAVDPAPADVGLTEPSVNVTETPDLSTEDAGESSEPAPGMTRCDTCGTERPLNAICPACEPAPADVDPEPKAELDEVEALAKAIHWADDSDPYNWPYVKEARRGEYRSMARVAREFIEAERIDAEAKRDQWKADVRDAAIARADRAEGLHKALREDMDRTSQWPDFGAHAGVLRNLLARDTERAES